MKSVKIILIFCVIIISLIPMIQVVYAQFPPTGYEADRPFLIISIVIVIILLGYVIYLLNSMRNRLTKLVLR